MRPAGDMSTTRAVSPTTTRLPSLMIPAFSAAIPSSVGPEDVGVVEADVGQDGDVPIPVIHCLSLFDVWKLSLMGVENKGRGGAVALT